jgi:uncharacterized OB-fold protein
MDWEKPLPHRTALAMPFWEGTRERELRLQRCMRCGAYRFPPQVLCRECLYEGTEWVATSGRGTVFSYVVQHRPATPAFADDVPYVVAVVELEEGPLILTNIVGCGRDEVSVGMPVEVDFVDATDEITLYPFRPRASAN